MIVADVLESEMFDERTDRLIEGIETFLEVEGEFHMALSHLAHKKARQEVADHFKSCGCSVNLIQASASCKGTVYFIHVTKQKPCVSSSCKPDASI